jgi:hypothetical protein
VLLRVYKSKAHIHSSLLFFPIEDDRTVSRWTERLRLVVWAKQGAKYILYINGIKANDTEIISSLSLNSRGGGGGVGGE